jgi:hypothetical protein
MHASQRLGKRRINRRQCIGQAHAGPLRQQRVSLSEQHQAERGGDQHRQGELRQRLTRLDGETDHATASSVRRHAYAIGVPVRSGGVSTFDHLKPRVNRLD